MEMSEIGISIHYLSKEGTDGVRTRDLRFTRPTPYHLATAPDALVTVPYAIHFYKWVTGAISTFFHHYMWGEKEKLATQFFLRPKTKQISLTSSS